MKNCKITCILDCLGNPKYVQFLYLEKRKLLLITGNNEKYPSSLAVPKEVYIYRLKDFRICHKHLIEAFALRLGWSLNENYSIAGAYNPDVKMVVFELDRAAITTLEPDDECEEVNYDG